MRASWPRLAAGLVALATASIAGCRRDHASAEVCATILDRIVDVELDEQGFHDEVLAARKKQEMRRLLDTDVRRCTGRRLRPDALACVKAARNTEEISHVCLR